MKTAIALTTLLLAAGGAQAAERLVNGGFESDAAFAGHTSPAGDDDAYLLHAGSTLMPGWTVIGGDVSWAHDGNPYGHANALPDDHYVLDLTAYESGPLGGVQQSFATVAGSVYTVTFQIGVGGSGPNLSRELTAGPVTFGSTVSNAGDLQCCTFQSVSGIYEQATWETASFVFVAAGTSSTLSIFGLSRGPNSSVFMGLDNVSVTGLAVPEPASVMLALLGLGVVGVAGRRARRTQMAQAAADRRVQPATAS